MNSAAKYHGISPRETTDARKLSLGYACLKVKNRDR